MHPSLVIPFTVPQEITEPLSEADGLLHPSVTALLSNAEDTTLMAVTWEHGEPEEMTADAWLALASAAYREAATAIQGQRDFPVDEPIAASFVLAMVANADRMSALGGREDIAIHRYLRELDTWGRTEEADDEENPTVQMLLVELEAAMGELDAVTGEVGRVNDPGNRLDPEALAQFKSSMEGTVNGLRRALAIALGMPPRREASMKHVDHVYRQWVAQR